MIGEYTEDLGKEDEGAHLQLPNEKTDIRYLMVSILRECSVLLLEFGGKGEGPLRR